MWSDAETEVDLLSVQHIVDALEEVVRDDRLSPVTIGVFGDWGSGKSSVVRMLRSRLNSDEKFLCVYFNGWKFEGYEDARAALASTILDELRVIVEKDKGKFASAIEKLDNLGRRVDWLRLGKGALNIGLAIATGGVSTIAGAATTALTQAQSVSTDDLAKLLKSRAEKEDELHVSIRDFHKEFADLLQLVDLTRIVVIVDDLDRCLPERVIDTLEAIRLFLAVERSAFVIAADEVMIRNAISIRYPAIEEKNSVGRDYLERMIQVPIEIPPLTRSDLEAYVHLLFAEQRLSKEDFARLSATIAARPFALDATVFNSVNAAELLGVEPTPELVEDLALATQVADVLALSVRGNPRQTKRFLNALMIRLAMLKKRGVEHQRAVAAKLLLLEYFNPDVFGGLADAAINQGGSPQELQTAETEARTNTEETPGDGTIEAPEGDAPKVRSSRAEPRSVSSRNSSGGKRAQDTASQGEQINPAEDLPQYLSGFRTDTWLRTWLASDPPLAGIDIRPYIHFARERLGQLTPSGASITPQAREVLVLLSSSASSSQRAGAERAQTLIQPDIVGVVRELSARARRNENPSREGSELHGLFELADKRPEISGDLLALLATLSPRVIEPSIVTSVLGLVRSHAAARPGLKESARQLLSRWAQSQNTRLVASANLVLARLDGGALSATSATPGSSR